MCEEAKPKMRELLWSELLVLRPVNAPKFMTQTRIEKVKPQLLANRDLWHVIYCKYGNHPLYDDPRQFITTSSPEQKNAVQTFWDWLETAVRETISERGPRHTWENLQNALANNWDVDITDADAQVLWAEFKLYLKKERQNFYNNERGYQRHCDKFGVEMSDLTSGEDFQETFSVPDCLKDFLTSKLGRRAGYEDETYVPAEYFQKFGKNFAFKNIAN